MTGKRTIRVRGAREHNLKGIDLEIPRDRLTVITGLSGSGKSSLAFDTIYAEGQRRYVESLSAYARQFLEQMRKPDVDSIEGLPPTISIEQRSGHATPRSTVATSTEIYDYIRLLFARVGRPHCYKCGNAITQQSADQIIEAILGMEAGTRIQLLAPVVRGKKGQHREIFTMLRREGFTRVRIDGEIQELRGVVTPDKNRKHEIEVVIDRLVVDPRKTKRRLADSVELGLKIGEGVLLVLTEGEEKLFSQKYACAACGISFGELQPRLFSFNSPYGACSSCDGLGTMLEFEADLVVPDKTLSLKGGAIEAYRKMGKRMTIRYSRRLRQYCEWFNVKYTGPFSKIEAGKKRILLEGTTAKEEKKYGAYFEGVIPSLMQRFKTTESEFVKKRLMGYMGESPCAACGGRRLRPESLAVRFAGKNINEVTGMTLEDALSFFKNVRLNAEERQIAKLVLKEIRNRLQFLNDVGLGYLSLDRRSSTLAGGETQRIRLGSQVGSGLVGVCYVLDEPTIGLHERDNRRLLETLMKLRDLGNTVIVVEHDEETIRRADHVVDIGPAAGRHGGEIVAQGDVGAMMKAEASFTGRYLSGEASIPVPVERRKVTPGHVVQVKGARENNLKNVDVRFPLGVFTCVTGVSGSGKSTLVNEILFRGLNRALHGSKNRPGAHDRITGTANLEKVIVIDQSPIGRTPRSNPLTYTGAFDEIRKLFSMTKESKARGYSPGRFSFNLKEGRCQACDGQGVKVIEMHFLPDVHVVCDTCRGRRYNRETLEVKYRGKDIAGVLAMSIEEALIFFANFPKIRKILATLDDVGLGYMGCGQSSTTLSGGEAQRVKLSTELAKASSDRSLYILDEPTTGLHLEDVRRLLGVLNRLVDRGSAVLVIEHNMHVIKTADWIVDLGPEGGNAGGNVVVSGTPEKVAAHSGSYTGKFLAPYLETRPAMKSAVGQ